MSISFIESSYHGLNSLHEAALAFTIALARLELENDGVELIPFVRLLIQCRDRKIELMKSAPEGRKSKSWRSSSLILLFLGKHDWYLLAI